jgi:L-proline amide hydrolase
MARETLTRHEAEGTTADPAYEAAVRVFYDWHLCRIVWPNCVERSFAQLADDPTVYHTMNGPSEFHCIGSLKTWDITERCRKDSTRARTPRAPQCVA